MENIIPKKSTTDVSRIIKIFLSYWLLFTISVIIAIIITFFYFRFASGTYSVGASILVKSDPMRTRSADSYVNVNDLMNQGKNLNTEIRLIQSTPFIKEVIYDLNLLVSYYVKEDKIPLGLKFGLNNIYDQSPFLVLMDKNYQQPIDELFYIQILDNNRFQIYMEDHYAYLYDFKNEVQTDNEYVISLNGVYKFGQTIKTNFCSFKILLNSKYTTERFQGVDLFFKFNNPDYMAIEFQKKLSVSSNFFESSIAHLNFEAENVTLGKEFLSNLINNYITTNLDKKNYDANNTIEYIEKQLANISGELGQSKRQILNFQSSRDAIDITAKFTNIFDQIQNLELKKSDLESQIQNVGNLLDYFQNHRDSETFIAPTSAGVSDETSTNLIQELTELSQERQSLISTNQLKNPRIKTIDASMTSLKNVILDNIKFSLASIKRELVETNKKLYNFNKEYATLPQTQRKLLELERELNVNDEVYTTLLNNRIQAKIIKASNRPDVEIVEPVRFLLVTSPSKKIAFIFIFLGFLFPSIFIVYNNFLTPILKSKEDLSKISKLTSVGDIPHFKKGLKLGSSKIPSSILVEKFHSIRSNLLYYLLGEKNKCILITSTLPSEGKSFTSLNLALSYAATGSKTLLINFDLRKRSKTLKEFNLNTSIGLDQYLINSAELEDITYETHHENLKFIHNGQIPPDPMVLLSLPRVKEMFEILKYEYDYIIVDTPPFGMVADAFMLMQYSDINLYVSRLGTVTKKALKLAMEDIQSKNIEKLYLIRNDLSKLDKTYSDKYAYGDTKKGFLKKIFSRS